MLVYLIARRVSVFCLGYTIVMICVDKGKLPFLRVAADGNGRIANGSTGIDDFAVGGPGYRRQ